MKIYLESEDALTLEATPGPLTIEADSADQSYSPFHMVASGLASCTFAVLESWATQAGLSVDDLNIGVRWTFADHPHRAGNLRVTLRWPSLPEARLEAARRVAAICAVHQTLSHPPQMDIEVAR